MNNRRADKRLSLPNAQIKVKKSERKHAFVACHIIDISFNGLAFSSPKLELDILQKIDFQLQIGASEVSGQGVICDASNIEKGKRYGLLYIAMEPPIEEAFNLQTLSANYMRDVAITMADNALASCHNNQHDRDLNKAWALLKETVDVFRNHLCENYSCSREKKQVLQELFIINNKQRSITVPLLDSTHSNVTMSTVKPTIDPVSKHMSLQYNSSQKRETVMEFLQELSDSFRYIFANEMNDTIKPVSQKVS